MLDEHKTKRQLLKELDEVRQRLAELDAAESRRRQTLTELRAKETLFRGVLESAPDAIVVTDPGGRITRVNAQAEKMFGYSRDELVGQAVETLLPERLRPQHVEHRADYVSQPRPRPMGTGLKIVGRRQDGSEFPADITLSPLETEDGLLVISSIRDIAGQKQMEAELRTVNRALRTLSDCNQVLVHVANEVELLQEICRVIVEVGDYRLAWVGYVEQDAGKTVRPVADAGYEEGFLESIHLTWADTEAGSGPTGTAIRTGQPCTATDISSKSCTPWRQEARERGHASAIALPLQTEDHVFGVLNIYSAEPDAFDTEEVKLLTELADDLAYGVVALRTREERARAEERLRQQTARAEALVRIAANLNAQLDMEAVLTTVCTETAGALSVPFVTVSLYDPKRDVLEMATDFGLPPE